LSHSLIITPAKLYHHLSSLPKSEIKNYRKRLGPKKGGRKKSYDAATAEAIRADHRSGVKLMELVAMYGFSLGTIHTIVKSA
jgi:hypothetical protein